jgi:uncharacterized protein (TIGR03435 family)
MRMARLVVAATLIAGATSSVLTQAPPTVATTPAFDVVSIKRNTAGVLSSGQTQRPDGGVTMTYVPSGVLISRAYPGHAPIDMIGLPGWAMSEYYDVSATASLTRPTAEDRAAMMRGMMADRFKLIVHTEMRDVPVYDLVLARSDGPRGPGVEPSEVDCAARAAAQRAAVEAAIAAGTPPPPPPQPMPPAERNGAMPVCSLFLNGDRIEGETTIANLVVLLRQAAGRLVVDKTGVTKTYRLRVEFDRMAGQRGPEAVGSPSAAPSVFTAVQEQLGLKLESSKASRETLVVDRIERPTEN